MSFRRLRRQCQQLLTDQIPIPDPFDVRQLCHDLAIQRGKAIELVPLSLSGGPSGMWLSTDAADYVFYERDTSNLHQSHIILHEIGHIVARHESSSLEDDVSRMFPNLNPALIRRMLNRTNYTDAQEREAEMIATLILQRGSRQRAAAPPHISPHDTDVITRIVDSLPEGGR